ncbi:hypothetical protein BFP76_13600 [Amylibacter kogurei]|uniref:Phasin domain-containing protein n=1 Tax=Paramylibacter kogurei TaxID=1889778 RepID=A0A2G5K912_9RHOB|nr:phasin family protein [Amylibacter kogurei]PIB26007.1 hypothetical protein BFP76_13600 [Amylibacter kogurei]
MTDTKKTAKTAADKTAETVQDVNNTFTDAKSAVSEAASAYVSGVTAITKSVFGIGKEIAQETVDHGKMSMKANCMRSLVEMQAGYVQHRVESSTVHFKTVADVTTESVKNVYAPIAELVNNRKAA